MHSKLEPLAFFVGRWSGEGQEGERRFRSEAVGVVLVPDAWLQVTERFEWEDGGEGFQDVSLYRYDGTREGYSVLHLGPGGRVDEYPITVEQGRVQWFLGPEAPEVLFEETRSGWRSRVGTREAPSISTEYHRSAE